MSQGSEASAYERATALGWTALVVGIVLRWVGVDAQSLWFDEVMSVFIARSDDVALTLLDDRHPPLFFYLLRTAYEWGLPVGASRYVSVLSGTLGFVLGYRAIAFWLTGRGLQVARWMYALSPFSIWFSREIRGYVVVELGLCLSLFALVSLRSRWARWIGCTLGSFPSRGPFEASVVRPRPTTAMSSGLRNGKSWRKSISSRRGSTSESGS